MTFFVCIDILLRVIKKGLFRAIIYGVSIIKVLSAILTFSSLKNSISSIIYGLESNIVLIGSDGPEDPPRIKMLM